MTTKTKADMLGICKTIDKTVDVEKIYLFGSHAYGTPTEDSDYDICVVIPDDSIRPAEAIKMIRRALFPIQQVPLDVIVYKASSFKDRQLGASLERKIAREGVLLYERKGIEQRMA